MTPLKTIGLTGNIGSGKSTVSVIFQKLGIPVYHADRETRKLYDLPDVKEQVIRLFGKVYQDNG
ncbi:MAG: dephospho-CoA kinase, partial [Syntrophothermus sp.]